METWGGTLLPQSLSFHYLLILTGLRGSDKQIFVRIPRTSLWPRDVDNVTDPTESADYVLSNGRSKYSTPMPFVRP